MLDGSIEPVLLTSCLPPQWTKGRQGGGIQKTTKKAHNTMENAMKCMKKLAEIFQNKDFAKRLVTKEFFHPTSSSNNSFATPQVTPGKGTSKISVSFDSTKHKKNSDVAFNTASFKRPRNDPKNIILPRKALNLPPSFTKIAFEPFEYYSAFPHG